MLENTRGTALSSSSVASGQRRNHKNTPTQSSVTMTASTSDQQDNSWCQLLAIWMWCTAARKPGLRPSCLAVPAVFLCDGDCVPEPGPGVQPGDPACYENWANG